MASPAEIATLRLRQPNLPAVITDAVAGQYLDDAAIDFPRFGIETSHPVYSLLLSLYACHLMAVNGLVRDTTAESVKDVSASYAIPPLGPGETRYYQAFKMTLRRNRAPGYILVST
jgi:hypothetical protein